MAAQWHKLTELLAASGDLVTLTWHEFDNIVGGAPASSRKHAAFWYGDRPHTRAWRAAGYELDLVVRGERVRFIRIRAGSQVEPSIEEAADPEDRVLGPESQGARVDLSKPDVLLISCVKQKLAQPAPARDLYVSPLFKKERAYAESLDVPWYILSAEHGIVQPDEWVAPYERYLPDTDGRYRAAWGAWVAARLELLADGLQGRVVEVHASADYVEAVRSPLEERGAVLSLPLTGMGLGARLAWYGAQRTTAELDPSPFIARLRDETAGVTPSEFRASKGRGLDRPGLYSWWVDDEGAAELSTGLGMPVAAGLFYAGLAGARRGLSTPTSTLWSRIRSNHIGGNRGSSTLRKSLSAVLDVSFGRMVTRVELNQWMELHLRLVTAPFADVEALGRLETAVLAQLDPPFNLDKVARTPLRRRLTDLRALAAEQHS